MHGDLVRGYAEKRCQPSAASRRGSRHPTELRRRSWLRSPLGQTLAIDHVAGICLGHGQRQVEFRLFECVDAIEWLALVDAIADLLEHLDARALVDGRAGGARQPVEPQAIDR